MGTKAVFVKGWGLNCRESHLRVTCSYSGIFPREAHVFFFDILKRMCAEKWKVQQQRPYKCTCACRKTVCRDKITNETPVQLSSTMKDCISPNIFWFDFLTADLLIPDVFSWPKKLQKECIWSVDTFLCPWEWNTHCSCSDLWWAVTRFTLSVVSAHFLAGRYKWKAI